MGLSREHKLNTIKNQNTKKPKFFLNHGFFHPWFN